MKNRSSTNLVAEYKYNGLGFRISWHYDADADADVDANDPWYYFAHDDHWRQVATFRGADTTPKESWVYHASGQDGIGTSNYLDSLILRDRDANTAWTSAADGTLEERRYLLQNWRCDVSVVIRDTNTSTQSLVLEWIKYSSYGVPFSIPFHDMDADGVFENADVTAYSTRYNTAVGAGAYDVRTDSNLDGSMTSNDQSAHTNDWLTAVSGGRGLLTRSDVANRFGYAAYQWDPAVRKYHVRFRAYDPELGRWLRRDPLGYLDGPSMYEYADSMPLLLVDSDGLRPTRPAATCTRGGDGWDCAREPGPWQRPDALTISCWMDPSQPGCREHIQCRCSRMFDLKPGNRGDGNVKKHCNRAPPMTDWSDLPELWDCRAFTIDNHWNCPNPEFGRHCLLACCLMCSQFTADEVLEMLEWRECCTLWVTDPNSDWGDFRQDMLGNLRGIHYGDRNCGCIEWCGCDAANR